MAAPLRRRRAAGDEPMSLAMVARRQRRREVVPGDVELERGGSPA